MVRGFVDMDVPQMGRNPDGSSAPLTTGSALRLDTVLAMRAGWRALADGSDLPTTQFEWAVAAMNQLGPKIQAYVAFATDGGAIRAILPLLIKKKLGVEHLEYMSPAIAMPIDICHTDKTALERLLKSVTKLGRPIFLKGMIEQSGAVQYLKELSTDRRTIISIKPAEPTSYLSVGNFALQDRIQSATRVSILATSYGLSGGPNDVIFQFVSPSLDQVMQLFHESMQLHASSQQAGGQSQKKRNKPRTELDTFEFFRTHAFHCAQRGEVRFSCLRLAGRLLAVQMFQVRKRTAWLLTAANLERFRSTTLSTLLMGETIRKLQGESVEKLVVPSATAVKDVGECRQMACVDVTIYPWSSRSLMAMVMGGAGRVSGRVFRRRRANEAHAEM